MITPISIYIAGVNRFNLPLAGHLCGGLCLHSFTTPEYTKEVIVPAVERGAERGDRSVDDVTVSASPFTITGTTEEEVEERREEVRERIVYYGSTRTYHDVLETHGWNDIGMELHERSKQKKWDEMPELVTDEIVATFSIEAPPGELADEIRRKYDDVVDRVKLTIDFDGSEMWQEVVNGFD